MAIKKELLACPILDKIWAATSPRLSTASLDMNTAPTVIRQSRLAPLSWRRTWSGAAFLAMLSLWHFSIWAMPTAVSSASEAPQASTFAAGLESPWGMEFLPDGSLLVTERLGRLRVISADGRSISSVHGIPGVDHRDHGGLLDVTIDPAFASNRFVYLSYTKAGRGQHANRSSLTVARARLNEDASRVDQFKVLFRQTPGAASGQNLGGRLAVSADGYLFLTIGDRHAVQDRMRAQALAYYQGKTVRIRTDGTVPTENPFTAHQGARPEIWSLGHRNPQGAFVHPDTGQLWIAEHGPQGGDEVNVVRKGLNYGWPLVTFGCEYDTCARIGKGISKPGLEPPLVFWRTPKIAPSNLILYTGNQFPQWKGNVFVGTLAGKSVWRLELAGDDNAPLVVRREALFADLGERIRDLRQGPDGGLYLLTDGAKARVVRVARADSAL